MTITNGYTDLATLKARVIEGTPATDSGRDTQMELVIQGVSRLIDNYCHRVFYKSASDETRVYTASDRATVYTDDIVSITTLKTDDNCDGIYERNWTVSDYRLKPDNLSPSNRIVIRPYGLKYFPLFDGGVQVVGIFGFNAVPDVVREACLLQCNRLWLRGDAPFGVVGSAEMGQATAIAKLDPDVELMLAGVMRL